MRCTPTTNQYAKVLQLANQNTDVCMYISSYYRQPFSLHIRLRQSQQRLRGGIGTDPGKFPLLRIIPKVGVSSNSQQETAEAKEAIASPVCISILGSQNVRAASAMS